MTAWSRIAARRRRSSRRRRTGGGTSGRASRCSGRRGRRAPRAPSASCRRCRRRRRSPTDGAVRGRRWGRRLRWSLCRLRGESGNYRNDRSQLSVGRHSRPVGHVRYCKIRTAARGGKKNAPKRVFKDPTEGDRSGSARSGSTRGRWEVIGRVATAIRMPAASRSAWRGRAARRPRDASGRRASATHDSVGMRRKRVRGELRQQADEERRPQHPAPRLRQGEQGADAGGAERCRPSGLRSAIGWTTRRDASSATRPAVRSGCSCHQLSSVSMSSDAPGSSRARSSSRSPQVADATAHERRLAAADGRSPSSRHAGECATPPGDRARESLGGLATAS